MTEVGNMKCSEIRNAEVKITLHALIQTSICICFVSQPQDHHRIGHIVTVLTG